MLFSSFSKAHRSSADEKTLGTPWQNGDFICGPRACDWCQPPWMALQLTSCQVFSIDYTYSTNWYYDCELPKCAHSGSSLPESQLWQPTWPQLPADQGFCDAAPWETLDDANHAPLGHAGFRKSYGTCSSGFSGDNGADAYGAAVAIERDSVSTRPDSHHVELEILGLTRGGQGSIRTSI